MIFRSIVWGLCISLSAAPANPWKKAAKPAPGVPESIGSYKAGCIRGAAKLPAEGAGYQIMRPSRNRIYGHPDLIGFIKKIARRAKAERLGPILVGDLGQPRGGPTMTGHTSHQNGLDVDFWFWAPARGKVLSWEERERLSSPRVVAPVFAGLNKKIWKPKMLEVLRLMAEHPATERILVDPVVKREACRRYAGRAWVGKLRPWWGHDNHYHVRVRCPAQNPLCVSQDAVSPGDGCDSTLSEWFTAKYKTQAKAQARRPAPPQMPVLPEACAKVLKD